VTLMPHMSVAWQHAGGDIRPSSSLAFITDPANFVEKGVPLASDSALIEVGGDLLLSAQLRVGLSYSGQFASRVHDNAVRGNIAWNF
jgi:outer membrane autotransporter protein